jgi:hypothetical protein
MLSGDAVPYARVLVDPRMPRTKHMRNYGGLRKSCRIRSWAMVLAITGVGGIPLTHLVSLLASRPSDVINRWAGGTAYSF